MRIGAGSDVAPGADRTQDVAGTWTY